MTTLELGIFLFTGLLAPDASSSTTTTAPASPSPAAPEPSAPKDAKPPAASTEVDAHDLADAKDPAMLERRTCAGEIDALMKEFLERLAAIEQALEALDDEMVERQSALDGSRTELAVVDAQIEQAKEAAKATKLWTSKAGASGKDKASKSQPPQLAQLQLRRLQLEKAIDVATAALATAAEKRNHLSHNQHELENDISRRYATLQAARASRREMNRCVRERKNARIEAVIDKETRTFRGIMKDARSARCSTALCWGPSNKWAFEPLAELPIGKNFSFSRSGLGRYINGNDIQVSFNAGLRFWAAWDWVSVAVYLSKPILNAAEVITVTGSAHEFSASQVRRPYPGLGVGLFGDILWISADFDQLRNGNAGALRAPEFRPNDVVSRTFTFTVAIAPIAGIRNGLGTLSQMRQREKDAEAKEAAEKAAEKATERAEAAEEAAAAAEERAKAAEEKLKAKESTEPGEQVEEQAGNTAQPPERPDEAPAPGGEP